jgi:hypothetical protein
MAIFLQIGFPKTATTSLQIAMKEHKDELESLGICYPLIDSDFKQRYLKFFDLKVRPTEEVLKKLSVSMELLKVYVEKSKCKDVILSCEELTNFLMMAYSKDNIKLLRDELLKIDSDIRIVSYVRNPSDFYLSILQEKLKRSGGVLTPEDFKTNFSKTIELYEDIFGVKALVKEFHPSKLRNNDIVADFFQTIGATQIDTSKWKSAISNETIPAEALWILDSARKDKSDFKITYTFKESELFWRKLNEISTRFFSLNKPVLFTHISEMVIRNNQQDIDELKRKYGIEFVKAKSVDEQSHIKDEVQLSTLERLVHVDRVVALNIWSIFCKSVISEVFVLRDKVKANKIRA